MEAIKIRGLKQNNFFDDIRKEFALQNKVDAGLFTFNGKGACPHCKGRGTITTELVFMDPVTTTCEYCNGNRYSEEALRYLLHGKTIVDVLKMSVEEALDFFKDNKKISAKLNALLEVGLPYISLGQSLSTFSGGERQRVKLAHHIKKKGSIYILDEPTMNLIWRIIMERYQDINAKIIDRWVIEGWEWGKAISHEEYVKATQGEWEVLLTPTVNVPKSWFGNNGDIRGKRILV